MNPSYREFTSQNLGGGRGVFYNGGLGHQNQEQSIKTIPEGTLIPFSSSNTFQTRGTRPGLPLEVFHSPLSKFLTEL